MVSFVVPVPMLKDSILGRASFHTCRCVSCNQSLSIIRVVPIVVISKQGIHHSNFFCTGVIISGDQYYQLNRMTAKNGCPYCVFIICFFLIETYLVTLVLCDVQALDEAIEIMREHASPVSTVAPHDVTSPSLASPGQLPQPQQQQPLVSAAALARQNSLVEELTDLISSATPAVTPEVSVQSVLCFSLFVFFTCVEMMRVLKLCDLCVQYSMF